MAICFMTSAVCRDDHRHVRGDRYIWFARTIGEALMSAANFPEAAVVIDGSRDPVASRRLDDLLREGRIRIEAVTETQARIARGLLFPALTLGVITPSVSAWELIVVKS
jgi:hypothetical protein